MKKRSEQQEPVQNPIEDPDAPLAQDIDDDAEQMQALEARVAELEAQSAENFAKFQRSVADHQNYVRRAQANELEARHQGRAGVIESLLTVMDHFDLALGQDSASVSVEQIVTGVQVIRDELLKSLRAHGVDTVSPARDESFDPMLHQAMMKVDDAEAEPGHIVATLQVGYTLGDRVLRPAKVSIAAEREDDPETEGKEAEE